MILIVAKSKIKEDKIEEYKNLAKDILKGSRAEEGNISYILYQSIENPTEFTFVEEWKDQEAIDLHNKEDHFLKFAKETADLKVESSVKLYSEI